MIPTYLTTVFSAPHLFDVAVALLLTAAAFAVARKYPAWPAKVAGAIDGLTCRVALCVVMAALIPVVCRFAVLPWRPPPEPAIHNEFSHLLVADTLLAGRLANPQHTLWRHLDTIYVLQKPAYASDFPLGQGFFLAAGMLLFGHPWAGVVLSGALMSGAICWMMFGCLPRKWAALGGLLAALAPGVAVDWQECYFGGAVGALGGALFFGALFRCWKSPSRAMGLVAALGWSIVWLSRPFEALLLLLLGGAFLAVQFFRAPRDWKKWLAPVAMALAVLVLTGMLTAAHNHAVTGSWTTIPYVHHQAWAGVPLNFYGQPVPPEPVRRPPEIRAMYAWQMGVRQLHAQGFFRYAGIVAFWAWAAYITPWYTLPLLLAGFLWRDRAVLACAVVVTLAAAVCLANPFFFPRYLASFACLFAFLVVRGSMSLSQWSVRGRAAGAWAVLFLTAGGCLMGFRLFPLKQVLGISSSPVQAGLRTQIERKLTSLPGQHAVLVRYGATHDFHEEWVYNRAEVDASPVVWCRALGPSEDVEVARYYKGRQIWWADVEKDSARLNRYAGPGFEASTVTPPWGTALAVGISQGTGGIAGKAGGDGRGPGASKVALLFETPRRGTSPLFATIQPDGSYWFDRLPPGEYALAVVGDSDTHLSGPGGGLDGRKYAVATVTVRAGETTHRDLGGTKP